MGKRYLDRLRSRPLGVGEGSGEVWVHGEREGVGVRLGEERREKRGEKGRDGKSGSRIRLMGWDSVWLWRIEYAVERNGRERDRGG